MVDFIKRLFKWKPKKRTSAKRDFVQGGINRSQGNRYRPSNEQFAGAEERAPGLLEDLDVEP